MSDARVRDVRLHHFVRPLFTPYVLSFATIRHFDVRVVEVEVDAGGDAPGRGFGEAVALPGYGEETDKDIAVALARIAPTLVGQSVDAARDVFRRDLPVGSFARSAVGFAIEAASCQTRDGGDDVDDRMSISWAQVAPMSSGKPAQMIAKAAELRDAGFMTLKVKIGRDVAQDISGIRAILADGPDDVTFRFDANQAYSLSDTRRVLDAFSSVHETARKQVELLEQPLAPDAWDDFAAAAEDAPIPLMLDESIYTRDDVRRAASVGASIVKLKGFKHDDSRDLVETAAIARQCGLRVVLGNGVASDIGNRAEAIARFSAPGSFFGAGEANGFAKTTSPVLTNPPSLSGGVMHWTGCLRETELRCDGVAGVL